MRSSNLALDETHEQVWRQRNGRRKARWAVVDLDSDVRPVYGSKKEGTDASYKGNLAYHPLVISLAGTQEVLRLINRSGNRPSADDAHEHLGELMPMLKRHHQRVLVRGDSAFWRSVFRGRARSSLRVPSRSTLWAPPYRPLFRSSKPAIEAIERLHEQAPGGREGQTKMTRRPWPEEAR